MSNPAASPLLHRGRPVQLGAEKELKLATLGDSEILAFTEPANPKGPIMRSIGASGVKRDALDNVERRWNDFNDRGKAAYAMAHKAATGKYPLLRTLPNHDYASIAFEPNDWIELVSPRFDSVADARVFLDKFGWGHIHTSFMRGAPAAEQAQMLTWQAYANVYMFVASLERPRSETIWPFAIKGLSVPSAEHMDLYADILSGHFVQTTAFSKHTMLNLRSTKKYGEAGRIGYETRGGLQQEKARVLDSLLSALTTGQWGAAPADYASQPLRFVRNGQRALQVKTLPQDFATLLTDTGITQDDAEHVTRWARGLRFFAEAPAARLNAFDQRACIPLYPYEMLPFLSDSERHRIVAARAAFVSTITDLARAPQDAMTDAVRMAESIVAWARASQLTQPLGRWLDGAERKRFFD